MYRIEEYIQGVSCPVDITAGDYSLGHYDQECYYQYVAHSPWLLSYGYFFNCRKRPVVNRASQVTLRDLETVGAVAVS